MNALAKSYSDHAAKIKKGRRTWFRTSNGFASRESTPTDVRRLESAAAIRY